MSLQFNQTASPYKGIVQMYEREIGAKLGFISSNSTRLGQFTSDSNMAFDDFFTLAIRASGKWQLDDSNQTDYPIITTNLVSGQKDYTFTTDETGNLILDVYKVMALPDATTTTYDEIRPVDQQQIDQFDLDDDLATEIGTTGTPWRYDKTANAIFLDPKPNYNATNGLKVYINREASYFATSDTTKKPGVDGRLHSYFYLRPALEHARRNNLPNAQSLQNRVSEMELRIEDVYGARGRDDRPVITNQPINYE